MAGHAISADEAERLLRNLACRLDREAPGVAASILEGLDEMLTGGRASCNPSWSISGQGLTHLFPRGRRLRHARGL
jgi:hypothetical protein